ncbi:hypothetical protein O9G_003104 [Rozella allomycis CSF55]|uniref:Uncharacterized protein n=1 Tax=Rozella allomycis (strain CSF55) TaxID=988480 RepID=A0A075AS98_ROZAC|nr:hypothetical protein O9G_003104 [Rozella allomycis CSF55]|eukprot:EPZ33108.1 hypothetical protein O9G_003104 [Rozella allomycis CSF55]
MESLVDLSTASEIPQETFAARQQIPLSIPLSFVKVGGQCHLAPALKEAIIIGPKVTRYTTN